MQKGCFIRVYYTLYVLLDNDYSIRVYQLTVAIFSYSAGNMIMIMIEIQGKGTACKPDRYIIRSNKINLLQKYILIFIKIIVNCRFEI